MQTHQTPSPPANSARLVAPLAGVHPAAWVSRVSAVSALLHAGLRRLALPLGIGGLLLTALLVYLPSLDDFFAADDFVFLQAANRHDLSAYLWRAVTFPHAEPFDLETPFWRPLVDGYFFLWWHLFGFDPLPYHLMNVVLHATVGMLTAVLVWQLTSARLTGLLAGLLFIVLPTHDYTVTWISDVTELLGTLWYLVALVSYAAFLRGGARSRWRYAAALSATALAFLSKQSTVTVLVPLAGLVVLIRPPTDRRAWCQRMVELLPFAALAVGFAALIARQEYPRYAAVGWYDIGGHMLVHWWDYLRWLTFPFAEPTYAAAQTSTGLRPWMSHLTTFAFLVVGVVAWWRRQALLAAMVLWAVVAFMPYLSATRPIEARYAYLASVPLCITLALLGHAVASWRARRVDVAWQVRLPITMTGVVLVGLVLITQTRERQHWMHEQAQAYQALVTQSPHLCGMLPPRSQIYLAADPRLWDLFGGFSSMAFNLLYEDVVVAPLPANQEALTSHPGATVCVIHYDSSADRYRRVAPSSAGEPPAPGR